MNTSKIYLDELVLLKILIDHKESISSSELFSMLKVSGIIFKNKNALYKKIEKLRNYGLVESFWSNTLPAHSNHLITKKGILLIEEFNKKYYYLEKKIIGKPIEYREKEKKELEPDELATLSQSVFYYLLEATGDEDKKISTNKTKNLQNIAERIVKEIKKLFLRYLRHIVWN